MTFGGSENYEENVLCVVSTPCVNGSCFRSIMWQLKQGSGGAESNPPVEEPDTGEEPGGEDPEPQYPIDLGTEFAIPGWTVGNWKANATIMNIPMELKLKVSENREFSITIPMSESYVIEVDNGSISNIQEGKQIVDLVENNRQYKLTADFTLKTNGSYANDPLEQQNLTVTEDETGSLIVSFSVLSGMNIDSLTFNPIT